jgi:hypothetical protein
MRRPEIASRVGSGREGDTHGAPLELVAAAGEAGAADKGGGPFASVLAGNRSRDA